MLAWLFLFALLLVELFVVRWWLQREFYPVFFSGWAATYYSLIFAADCVLAWLVSMFYRQGGTIGMQIMLLVGFASVLVTYLLTIFFRWVVKHDMTDIPKGKE